MEKLKNSCTGKGCINKSCPDLKKKIESRINRIEGQIRRIENGENVENKDKL